MEENNKNTPVAAQTQSAKELYTKAKFPGQLVMLGCGTIGQCMLPMLLRHTDITPERMKIIAANGGAKESSAQYGVAFIEETLTPENYAAVLKKNLKEGDFLLNLCGADFG